MKQQFRTRVKIETSEIDSYADVEWFAELEFMKYGFHVSITVPDQDIVVCYDGENEEGDVITKETTLQIRDVTVSSELMSPLSCGIEVQKIELWGTRWVAYI